MQSRSWPLIPLILQGFSLGVAELRFSQRTMVSLKEQDDYLRPLNPKAADAVLAEIAHTCDLIADFPLMGRAIDGTGLRYHVTRKYRYRVVYRVAGDLVEVRDVLHPRQK